MISSSWNLVIVVIPFPSADDNNNNNTGNLTFAHFFPIWYFAIKLDTIIAWITRILERKLSKLKNTPNILEQLKARREHCIENLLVGNIDCTYNNAEDNQLNEDLESNRRRDLLRYIQPEQPINLGELVTIINHDQLEQDRKENSSDDEATK